MVNGGVEVSQVTVRTEPGHYGDGAAVMSSKWSAALLQLVN